MPFELAFHPEALREWRKLTPGIREQFKNKLAERLTEPRIPASKLRLASPAVVSFPRHLHPGVAGVEVHLKRLAQRLALQGAGPFPWFENHLHQTNHAHNTLCRA